VGDRWQAREFFANLLRRLWKGEAKIITASRPINRGAAGPSA
jgi:hypothetical protein